MFAGAPRRHASKLWRDGRRGGWATGAPCERLPRKRRVWKFGGVPTAALLALGLLCERHIESSEAFGVTHTPSDVGTHQEVDAADGLVGRRLQSTAAPVLSSLELVLAALTGQRRAPVLWQFSQFQYSMTVPSEAVAVALVATIAPNAAPGLRLMLFLPDDGGSSALASGEVSPFVDVPTEEATHFVLELRLADGFLVNYTVAVIRSTITSSYQFRLPDPAAVAPPQATLAGLSLYDMYGVPARMTPVYFTPRHSQYIASVGMGVAWMWVVASKNDPDARLEMRINGQEWEHLQSGVGSSVQAVPDYGWLMVEVRVTSPAAAASGFAPLVYQAVVARQIVCHERCVACFGPGESDCLRCRAPFSLNGGRCEQTACPPNAYLEWDSFQCRKCDASCAQCVGPGASACRLCPALSFLLPENPSDTAGPCVAACPPRTFAHPASRRCRSPPAATVKTFYVRCLFRVLYTKAQRDANLQESIVNTTAFVLGLSLSDVRPFSMGSAKSGRLIITMEIVSPFISKAEADRVSIDTWFGAFREPVDEVTTQTWEELHPPVPVLPDEPFLPTWVWGFIASAGMTFLLLIPMYFFYFRRLSNAQRRFTARVGVDPQFVNIVVDQSPAWLIRRFVAKDYNHKQYIDRRSMD